MTLRIWMYVSMYVCVGLRPTKKAPYLNPVEIFEVSKIFSIGPFIWVLNCENNRQFASGSFQMADWLMSCDLKYLDARADWRERKCKWFLLILLYLQQPTRLTRIHRCLELSIVPLHSSAALPCSDLRRIGIWTSRRFLTRNSGRLDIFFCIVYVGSWRANGSWTFFAFRWRNSALKMVSLQNWLIYYNIYNRFLELFDILNFHPGCFVSVRQRSHHIYIRTETGARIGMSGTFRYLEAFVWSVRKRKKRTKSFVSFFFKIPECNVSWYEIYKKRGFFSLIPARVLFSISGRLENFDRSKPLPGRGFRFVRFHRIYISELKVN